MVLLGVSVFAIWSTQTTATAARRAVTANRLSDDFALAASAVAAEESWERKYRLEPGPAVRVRFNTAAAGLVTALNQVRADGAEEDRVLVVRVLGQHRTYLAGIDRMFQAVDRHDTKTALAIDGGQVDPSFAAIEKAVLDEAVAEHATALHELHSLQRVEAATSRLTPAVFVLSLILTALFAAVIRSYRRLLVTERARAVYDSLHDGLTGLPNRALLADRFDQALRTAKRTGTTTGLLLLDLDRFKDINDTFGHHYGDALLTMVGPRLKAALRESDTIARLGGDEFVVLLPDVGDIDAATAVAAKLRQTLETSFHVGGIDLDVEASVGVVLSGEHGDDAATLLQRADIAMYVAKTRNLGIVAYHRDSDGHSPERLALLGELRRALERRELTLHYQPKISLSTGDVVGAEALVRWQHPTRGLVVPDEFIPVAEHTGLIGPLTRYVVDAALAQSRTWADAGQALPISVNLSARNLLDERLPDQIAELLTNHRVGASMLELEVTESAIMTEPARARRLLQRLSDLGIHLSIDDFGAGYTSLGQLRSLPINELKIDRSFVMNMAQDPGDALIVRSIIDLGHNLGLTIVAEGVETADALTTLAGFGCDVAQGYYLSRPMPIDAFDTWRRNHQPTPLPPAPQLIA